MEVFFDCQLRLSLNFDVKEEIFSGDDSVFFGFVGSTGGLSNLHQVCFKNITFVDNLQLEDQTVCEGDAVIVDLSVPGGVTYSWEPTEGVDDPSSPETELSPDESTVYTVTITDECGDTFSQDVNITVVDDITPTFEDFDTFCENDAFPDLPSISSNDVEGEWFPEEIDADVEEYTFTPFLDCANEVTITLEFEDSVEPEFNLPADICEGDLVEFPLTSENGIPGTWSPEFNPNTSTTYTFSPEEEFCASEVSFLIEVVDGIAQIENLIPEDLTQECDLEVPEPPIIDPDELCDSIEVVFDETVTEGECPVLQEIVRT